MKQYYPHPKAIKGCAHRITPAGVEEYWHVFEQCWWPIDVGYGENEDLIGPAPEYMIEYDPSEPSFSPIATTSFCTITIQETLDSSVALP